MLAARTFFRDAKVLRNYICTSHVLKCEENKESKDTPNPSKKKKQRKQKRESPKEKTNINLSSAAEQQKIPENSRPKDELEDKIVFKTDFFKKLLKPSVESVAEDLGGNKKETTLDLLSYIKTFEISKERQQTNESTVGDAWTEHHKKPYPTFNPHLMITTKQQVKLNIWDSLEAEHLRYLSLKPPANHFEELIKWTEEGKLWRFPIDNDQGLEEEGKVSFTEHVFLEQHLEPWCPKKGPLRKFMELVLVGLSKNPYLTVAEKKEHIHWFEKYFERKKKLLQELGAVGATKEIGSTPSESQTS